MHFLHAVLDALNDSVIVVGSIVVIGAAIFGFGKAIVRRDGIWKAIKSAAKMLISNMP